jgi:hypothetical protein
MKKSELLRIIQLRDHLKFRQELYLRTLDFVLRTPEYGNQRHLADLFIARMEACKQHIDALTWTILNWPKQ